MDDIIKCHKRWFDELSCKSMKDMLVYDSFSNKMDGTSSSGVSIYNSKKEKLHQFDIESEGRFISEIVMVNENLADVFSQYEILYV